MLSFIYDDLVWIVITAAIIALPAVILRIVGRLRDWNLQNLIVKWQEKNGIVFTFENGGKSVVYYLYLLLIIGFFIPVAVGLSGEPEGWRVAGGLFWFFLIIVALTAWLIIPLIGLVILTPTELVHQRFGRIKTLPFSQITAIEDNGYLGTHLIIHTVETKLAFSKNLVDYSAFRAQLNLSCQHLNSQPAPPQTIVTLKQRPQVFWVILLFFIGIGAFLWYCFVIGPWLSPNSMLTGIWFNVSVIINLALTILLIYGYFLFVVRAALPIGYQFSAETLRYRFPFKSWQSVRWNEVKQIEVDSQPRTYRSKGKNVQVIDKQLTIHLKSGQALKIDNRRQIQFGIKIEEIDRQIKRFFNAQVHGAAPSTISAGLDSAEKAHYIKEADKLLAQQRYREAAQLYEKAVDGNPPAELLAYHFVIGECYRKCELWNQALTAYEKAVEYTPTHDQAHEGMADCYFSTQQYQQAVISAEKALAINPENQHAQHLLAMSQSAEG